MNHPRDLTNDTEQYENEIILEAFKILQSRIERQDVLSNPAMVELYLTARLAQKEHEVFGLIYLDHQNRVIDTEELFRGTINHSVVYPREVIKAALAKNASCLILFHNHPGGTPTPSPTDVILTRQLAEALKLVDITIHDHIIVSGLKTYSFLESGRMPIV